MTASLFAAAVNHFRARQLGEAEKCCRDILTVEPNHFDALHLLGVIAFQIGRHDGAAELIGRAVAVNGNNAECHFNLAQALRALGRLDEAMTHLAQAAALKRYYPAAHVALGDVLVQREQFAGACARYQQALVFDPRFIPAHYGLANALMQQGRNDAAEEHYRRVLALKPDFAEACNNLGIVLAAKGDWAGATAQYQRALALKPDLVDVYRNLGRIVLAQGGMAQALALARRALAVKDTEEARIFFVQCVKQMPPAAVDAELTALIARALSDGWSRPSELAPLAAEIFKLSTGAACMARAAAGVSTQALFASGEFSAVSRDPLLRALLVSAPVRDVALERFLTAVRSALLEFSSRCRNVCRRRSDQLLLCARAPVLHQ